MSRMAIEFFYLCLLFVLGCQYEPEQAPFEKQGWLEKVDNIVYPNRERMLNDLITRHKLLGLTAQELKDVLGPGEPWSSEQSQVVCFTIVTDFGLDIDPVYIKNMLVTIGHDSIVTDVRIHEWKKGEEATEYRPNGLIPIGN